MRLLYIPTEGRLYLETRERPVQSLDVGAVSYDIRDGGERYGIPRALLNDALAHPFGWCGHPAN